MTRLMVSADRFNATLTRQQQNEALKWFKKHAPGRLVITAELLDEGRIRLQTVRDAVPYVLVFGSGCTATLITTAKYVTTQPPPALIAVMELVKEDAA